jgi:hypothetical protein
VIGDYQLNQAGASFDVNGLQGSLLAPAVTSISLGSLVTVNWTSTNAGLPFDVAVASSLVPAGLVAPDGQVVNIDLAAPFTWVFGGGFTNAFGPASLLFTPPFGTTAAQMAVLDPAQAIGFSISQPNRLDVL